MGQPTKTNDYEKYISQEMLKLMEAMRGEFKEMTFVNQINIPYFIYTALSNRDSMLYKAANSFLNNETLDNIRDAYYAIINDSNNSMTSNAKPFILNMGTDFKSLLRIANIERRDLGHETITSDHMLLALLNAASEKYANEFSSRGLTYDILVDQVIKLHELTDTLIGRKADTDKQDGDSAIISMMGPFQPGEMPNLEEMKEHFEKTFGSMLGIPGEINVKFIGGFDGMDVLDMNHGDSGNKSRGRRSAKDTIKVEYCTNLNQMAKSGGIDGIIGREKEIELINKILNRRKSNNVVIIGKQGVGKTALIEGLAKMINDNNCPRLLMGKTILRLNPYELMAGTQFRGMFEARFNGVLDKLREKKDCILFIDNFNEVLSDKNGESYDFTGCLNEAFNKGGLMVIATTTQEGFRAGFENTGLSKKFQRIDLDAPSDKECVDILMSAKEQYEKFHKVKYTDEAIHACINLSGRYITDKSMPSSAIDILDESGAQKKIRRGDSKHYNECVKTIDALKIKKDLEIKSDNMEKAGEIDKLIDNLQKEINSLDEKESCGTASVSAEDMYEAVSLHTGIPVSRLSTSEKKSVSNIDKVLKENIIGQDDAIDKIARCIKRSKVGLFPANRPLGSFMSIGTTGCGKSLTAKILAKEIFGDEKYLIKFDMSEYADKTAVNKLIGASAGYVGYEKGGLLTEAIKNKKYAVLLIDEIEKADPEVYNIFLQILDEGHLTDNVGYKVDFKNVIIIFTSNVGTKEASMTKAMGFNADDNATKMETIQKVLKDKFAPEFLNRLDEIIYYNILSEESLKSIIRLELSKLQKRMGNINATLSYDEGVVEYIYRLVEPKKDYGARPILRAIQDEIENRISDIILEEESNEYDFAATVTEEKLKIEKK